MKVTVLRTLLSVFLALEVRANITTTVLPSRVSADYAKGIA